MLSQKILKEIDPLCRDLVIFFNEVGLETKNSCQGHPKSQKNPLNTMFRFYIEFSRNVTDEHIKDFMRKFEEPFHKYREEIKGRFRGKFVKTAYKTDDFRWRYVVDGFPDYRMNQILAEEDYKNFKILYK